MSRRRRNRDDEDRQEIETAPISWLTPVFVLITLGLIGVLAWWVVTPPADPSAAPTPTRTPVPPTATPVPPTATPTAVVGRNTPRPQTLVGIIAGHNRLKTLPSGETVRDLDGVFDPGATCEGLSAIEANITLDVAQRVAAVLRREDKLEVQLLGEFDPRLRGFLGAALVSLHVDACIKGFSGYKVARLTQSLVPDIEDRLVNCLRERYQSATGLFEHRNTITPDMQEYHAFREMALTTPGAILEMGFLRDDQALLVQGDLVVEGVVDGIRCFVKR